jgi:hypothetical protein
MGCLLHGVSWPTLHVLLFGFPYDARLSAVAGLNLLRMFVVLIAGGLLVGQFTALRRKQVGTIVDPVEASTSWEWPTTSPLSIATARASMSPASTR